MHPAFSVIVFTVSSGIGYGMLFWLAINVALGNLSIVSVRIWPADLWFGLVAFGIAFIAIVAGLLSSTFHLGHPERAWRAFSQWRSSWLSREGVASVLTFVPTGLFAIGWIFLGDSSGWWLAAGIVGAACCLATVYCTAMIYGSLRPIKAWNLSDVPMVYLALSLASGAVWLGPIARIFAIPFGWSDLFVPVALALAAALKWRYWARIDAIHRGDGTGRMPTRGSAIGLPQSKSVQPLDPPHTQQNYLMKEMGFAVARRHATKLRGLSLLLLFALPALAWLLALVLGPLSQIVALAIGALAMTIGLLIERWLFFAEAKHTVMLYYRDNETR